MCWHLTPCTPCTPNRALTPGARLLQKLYLCEFTLSFFPQRAQLVRHLQKCKRRCPPGTEIYRNGNISMFEVDGAPRRLSPGDPRAYILPLLVSSLFTLSV